MLGNIIAVNISEYSEMTLKRWRHALNTRFSVFLHFQSSRKDL